MAVIPQSLAYNDTDTLDTALHSDNVFSATGSEGIVSEGNGGLDATNLAPGFTARSEHIWPGEAVRAYQESGTEGVDFVDDALSTSLTNPTFISLPHLTIRRWFPYAPSVAIWSYQLFMSFWVYPGVGTPSEASAPDVLIRAYINGSSIPHSTRTVPDSVFRETGSTVLTRREQRNAHALEMCHMSAGTLSAGWNEFTVRLFMEHAPRTGVTIQRGNAGWTGSRDFSHTIFSRVTLGLRNCRVIAFL